jgi:hypothetical protein
MTPAENVETLPQPRGGNYEIARFNALRPGVLSQYTVLPWEGGAEYGALIEALAAEHSRRGRRRSISSRSWPEFSGANGGFGSRKLRSTIAGWRKRSRLTAKR